MTEIPLEGCRTTPLLSYLKALGTLRLVGEQVDLGAVGWWENQHFVIRSVLDGHGLVDFLCDAYVPTPIIAPWNKRGGFRRDENRESEKALARLASTTSERLGRYREVAAAAWRVVDEPGWAGWTKSERVGRLRAELPDDALGWFDATVVLTGREARFPPILGTGGNFGSGDLSNNFMQWVVLLLGADDPGDPSSKIGGWCRACLFGEPVAGLPDGLVGQFDPGAAGGARVGRTVLNPWDFVLGIEGAMLFASGTSRRMGSADGPKASMPFTFDVTPAGYVSAAEAEAAKAELWTPLWRRPAGLAEVSATLGEGRVTWRGIQARSGLDALRAAVTLGVDRGIAGFERYAFVDRLGKATLAVPVGRMAVGDRPGVDALGDLDRWMGRLRALPNAPAALRSWCHRLERAIFAATSSPTAPRFQAVLTAAGSCEALLGRSNRLLGEVGKLPSVLFLDPTKWMPLLDDGSLELRLATALALSHDRDASNRLRCSLGLLLRPIEQDQARRWQWKVEPPEVGGLGTRTVMQVLADVLLWRAHQADLSGSSWGRPRRPGQGDVVAMVCGQVDMDRLEDVLSGLLFLDPMKFAEDRRRPPVQETQVPPTAWSLLAPFFSIDPADQNGEASFRARPDWPGRLRSGRAGTESVLREAVVRLRAARRWPLVGISEASISHLASTAPPPDRLVSSLLVPPHILDLRDALRRVSLPSSDQEVTTHA